MAFWGIAEALIETAELLQMPNILEDVSQARLEQVIAVNPHSGKALKGKLKSLNSYRLNRQDPIFYEICEQDKTVLIIRARTHYGE